MNIRGYHASSEAELEGNNQYIFRLVEMRFDSGTDYFTNAHKDILYDSNTYVSTSRFINSGDITETQGLTLSSMRFTLSGVELTSLAKILSEPVLNREIVLYEAMLDLNTYLIIADPLIVYKGRIKSFEFNEKPGNGASIILNTASIMADFNRTAGRRTSHQDQETYLALRSIAGTDLGFEYASQITADLKWGRP